MKYIVFVMKTIMAMHRRWVEEKETGDGKERAHRRCGRVPLPASARTPPRPHPTRAPKPRRVSRKGQRGFAPPAKAFALRDAASALRFPAAPAPGPVSIAAFSCLCTGEAWRMGERRPFSPGCHVSVAAVNDRVSAQCKRNWALFIPGGKRCRNSGSVPRWEEAQAVAIPAPSPPFWETFKLPRRRFASRFPFLHLNSY